MNNEVVKDNAVEIPADMVIQMQNMMQAQLYFEKKFANLMGSRDSTIKQSAMFMHAVYMHSPGNVGFVVHTKHTMHRSRNLDVFVPTKFSDTYENVEKYVINEAAEEAWLEACKYNMTKINIQGTCLVTQIIFKNALPFKGKTYTISLKYLLTRQTENNG